VIYDTNAVSEFLDGNPGVTEKIKASAFHGLPVMGWKMLDRRWEIGGFKDLGLRTED